MTRHIAVTFGPVAGTGAGLGRAGRNVVLADRPEGKAGGTGLGFNGAELLAGALGGCLWNDLHYTAHDLGIAARVESVDAEVELAGTPPRVVRARLSVGLSGAPETELERLFAAASELSTIAASLKGAIQITFERKRGGAR